MFGPENDGLNYDHCRLANAAKNDVPRFSHFLDQLQTQ